MSIIKTSGIFEQAVSIDPGHKEATHFALYNGEKIRYLISLQNGKKYLSKNISSYSTKLTLLMRLLNLLPFVLLEKLKMGQFIRARLHPKIEEKLQNSNSVQWNMIVGTYDEKQKVVLQDFTGKKDEVTFIKVGNRATSKEMQAEINFLTTKHEYRFFSVPEIIGYQLMGKESQFNMQVTREFIGTKVTPGINGDIIKIYREISMSRIIDERGLEFSHGDFAPWNMKSTSLGYILFDWEHCGFRKKGFDLLHYVVVPKIKLEKKSLNTAIDEALLEIQEYLPDFTMDKELFCEEYNKLRLE